MAVSMDALTASLDAHLDVAQNPYDINHPHPRLSSYAHLRERASEMGDQHKRRKEHLERQKSKRDKTVSQYRKNLELPPEESKDVCAETVHHSLDTAHTLNTRWNFANQLMMSEWLVDVPPDFAENWLAKPCPKGRRMLVVANQGLTKAYSKAGHLVACFKSYLPGGRHPCPRHCITVLDCIWNRELHTYYILDILTWNNTVVLDSETEFRFYWLHTKIDELPEVQKHNETNKYAFIPLPYSECKSEVLTNLMGSYPLFPDGPAVDGVLFYHRETIYEHKTTPLVTWLKPFMVQDILGIQVAEGYIRERPEGYQSQDVYIQEFELCTKARRNHFRKFDTKLGKKRSNERGRRQGQIRPNNEDMEVNIPEMDVKSSEMDCNAGCKD